MDFFERFRKIKDEAIKSQLFRALVMQKGRFLCAIGKAEQSSTKDDDENNLKQCNEYLNPISSFSSLQLVPQLPRYWTDAIANNTVKQILDKHGNFDKDLYLDCAKAIYLTYSGNIVSGYNEAFTYVLTHARQFGDPSQNMFKLECNGKSKDKVKLGAVSEALPDTKYMREIIKLIEDLKTEYDETKYMILNCNVTYLTLLILRRFVRGSLQFLDALNRRNIHEDYLKLCPYPLDSKLPIIGKHFNIHLPKNRLQTPAYLAIHAYLTVNEGRSKHILRKTCIQYIEWTGLQLPGLFFNVVNLYGIEEAELWDMLCFDCTYPSLFKLANDYHELYEKGKTDPAETVEWFPFCRALNEDYHMHLSAPENLRICMILAYLIDLKVGFEKSRVRVTSWAKTYTHKESTLEIARVLYEMHLGNTDNA